MPELTTKTSLTANVIKSEDLPDDVLKAADGEDIDKWFYASVEAVDRDGDIVRIGGMDTDSYAKTGGAIKFISNHKRDAMPDGRLPIVGKAVRWQPTTHKTLGVPAMAVGIKFAPTLLGQEFKTLYDGGFLSDVSIGFKAVKADPMKEGGFDVKQSRIGEISACVIGANQYAGLMKALKDEEAEQPTVTLKVKYEPDTEGVMGSIFKHIETQFTDHFKKLQDRLDDIECKIVIKSEEEKQTDDRDPSQHADSAEALSQFAALAKSLAASLH